jgi:hypothetical protein
LRFDNIHFSVFGRKVQKNLTFVYNFAANVKFFYALSDDQTAGNPRIFAFAARLPQVRKTHF